MTPGYQLLPERQVVIGEGQHRSGWPYAFQFLRSATTEGGILLDDFVEQRFCYHPRPDAHRTPWIGIFHHPPYPPPFTRKNEILEDVFCLAAWQASAEHLLGTIALSEHLGSYLEAALGKPNRVVRHPTEVPALTWSPDAYRASRQRWLVQVGWYQRNTRVGFQIPELHSHRKIRVWPPNRPPLHWVHEYDERVRAYWAERGERMEVGGVTDYPPVSPQRYDQLFSRQVILTEVFDASANNVVIECIARNTPLVVNRHPAIEEYLGPDYPLFFESVAQVPELVAADCILAAHEYLKVLPKKWLSGETFVQDVQRAVQEISKRGRGSFSNGKRPPTPF